MPLNHPFFPAIMDFNIIKILNAIKYTVGHADFLTLINIWGSLKCHQHGVKHFLAFLAVSAIIPPTGNGSWLVMIGPIQAVPCFPLQTDLPVRKYLFQFRKRNRAASPFVIWIMIQRILVKLKYHIQLPSFFPCIFNRLINGHA